MARGHPRVRDCSTLGPLLVEYALEDLADDGVADGARYA